MSRKFGDISMEREFPPLGEYPCAITGVKRLISKEKKTPYLELIMTNGQLEFTDNLFITAKTFKRLCLVAKRVCKLPDDTPMPDDDGLAAKELANYIEANITGKRCGVVIEENEEIYIPESGPDMGHKITRKRRRVAFNGYKEIADTVDIPGTDVDEANDIPF